MKRKLLSFVLAAAMVLSMPTALFAAEIQPKESIDIPVIEENDGTIMPMSVFSSNIGASRYSSTSGNVSAYAAFNKTAKSYLLNNPSGKI